MHFFKSKKKNLLPLYNKIVLLTRENFLYQNFQLSDTFSTRIYLLFFHLSFLLINIKDKGNYKSISQDIFDFFIKQIEINFRELGYGDTDINKKMKQLIKLFYEILDNVQKWESLNNESKHKLFSRFFSHNLYQDKTTKALTNYFKKFSFFIKNIPLKSLAKGVFKFNYKD